jgi:hypothetical protein
MCLLARLSRNLAPFFLAQKEFALAAVLGLQASFSLARLPHFLSLPFSKDQVSLGEKTAAKSIAIFSGTRLFVSFLVSSEPERGSAPYYQAQFRHF